MRLKDAFSVVCALVASIGCPFAACAVSFGGQEIKYAGSVEVSDGGDDFVLFKFTSGNGTLTLPAKATADVLVVGGGGGGGRSNSSSSWKGGAGGEVLEMLNQELPAGDYGIKVGVGGAGGASNGSGGTAGSPSSFVGSGYSLEADGGVGGSASAGGTPAVGTQSQITGVAYGKGGASNSTTSGNANTGNGGGGNKKGNKSGAGGSGVVIVRITAMVPPPYVDYGTNTVVALRPGETSAAQEVSGAAADVWRFWSEDESVATVSKTVGADAKAESFAVTAGTVDGETYCVASNRYAKHTFRVVVDSSEVVEVPLRFTRDILSFNTNLTASSSVEWTVVDADPGLSVRLLAGSDAAGAGESLVAREVIVSISASRLEPSKKAVVLVKNLNDKKLYRFNVFENTVSGFVEEKIMLSQHTAFTNDVIDVTRPLSVTVVDTTVANCRTDGGKLVIYPTGADGDTLVEVVGKDMAGNDFRRVYIVVVATVSIVKAVRSDADDPSKATVSVVSHVLYGRTHEITNHVLFLGTLCNSHTSGKIMADVLKKSIEALAQQAEVDYFFYNKGQAAAAYSGSVRKNGSIDMTGVTIADSGNHGTMLGFYTKLDEIARDVRKSAYYDFIVLECDGSRLAADTGGYVVDLARERRVATFLESFYAQDRVLLVVDQWNSRFFDGQGGRATEGDYFRPYPSSIWGNEPDGRWEAISDANFRGLIGLMNPWIYLDKKLDELGPDAAGIGECFPTVTGMVYSGGANVVQERMIGEVNTLQAIYQDADLLAKYITDNVHLKTFSVVIDDHINTNGLSVVGGAAGVGMRVIWERPAGVTDPRWMPDADDEAWETYGVKARADVVGNNVSGTFEDISRELWVKMEIPLQDDGRFLIQDETLPWVRKDPETGEYLANPNSDLSYTQPGKVKVALYESSSVEVYAEGAAETTVFWDVPENVLLPVVEGAYRVYDGISTNLQVLAVTNQLGRTVAEYAVVRYFTVSSDGSVTNTVTGFADAMEATDVYVEVVADGYLAPGYAKATVEIAKAPIQTPSPGEEPVEPGQPYTCAPSIERVYDGTPTNIVPRTENLVDGNVESYLYCAADEEGRPDGNWMPWEDLQLKDVKSDAEGIASNKVFYVLTTDKSGAENYFAATNYAFVTILPRPVTVTAAGATMVHGDASTLDDPAEIGWTASDGFAAGEGVGSVALAYTNAVDATLHVGAYPGFVSTNGADAVAITNAAGADVTFNYSVAFVPGALEVTRAPGFVGPIGPAVYDGGGQTPPFAVTNAQGVALAEGADYAVRYFDNTNATDAAYAEVVFAGDYEGVATNRFTIGPRPAALSSGDATFPYDGNPHAFTNLSVSGFVEGEGLSSTSDWATVTEVAQGEVGNAFEYALKANTLAQNYAIAVSTGRLAVVAAPVVPKRPAGDGSADNPSEEPAEGEPVTLWARNVVKMYDGLPTNVVPLVYNAVGGNGFAYEYSTNETDWVADLAFTNVTDALKVFFRAIPQGTTPNYVGTNGYAFVTILPRPVTVTAAGATMVHGDASTLDDPAEIGWTASDGFAAGEGVGSVALAYTNAVDATLHVGAYPGFVSTNGADAVAITNAAGADVTFDYSVAFVPGALTVVAAPPVATVPLLAGRMQWKYFKAENAFYGGLDVVCTNGNPAVVSNLCYIYEDRAGFYLRDLRSTNRLSDTSRVMLGGKAFGKVVLDPSALRVGALFTTNRYGVSDAMLASPRFVVSNASERVIALATTSIPDLATNKVSAVVEKTLGYLTWQEDGIPGTTYWSPLAADLPPLAGLDGGAAGASSPMTLATVNRVLGYGLPPTTLDIEPSLQIAAFDVGTSSVSGRISIVGEGRTLGAPGPNARLEIFGAFSPAGPFSLIATPSVGADGSFSARPPEGLRFFKARLRLVPQIQ